MRMNTRRFMICAMPLLLVMLGACKPSPPAYLVSQKEGGKTLSSADNTVRQGLHEIAITPKVVARLLAEKNAIKISPPKLDDAPYDYQLAPGDQLLIRLSIIGTEISNNRGGIIELNSRISATNNQVGTTVDRDGTIAVPLLGMLNVKGKTITQLREMLYERAKKYYKRPLIEAKILEYRSHQASVTGAVKSPTTIILQAVAVYLAQAIEQAGGYNPNADLRSAYVIHASGDTTPIDLVALLIEGKQEYNYRLRSGDVVHVPISSENKIFVFGEVIDARAYTISPISYSLADALGDALGPNPVTSGDMVYVIRGAVSESALKKMRARGEKSLETYASALGAIDVYRLNISNRAAYSLADHFPMRPRDVVYVAPGTITHWSRFINQLLPLGLSTAVTAGTNVRNTN
jgi:polysaccharide export outer membrane protein